MVYYNGVDQDFEAKAPPIPGAADLTAGVPLLSAMTAVNGGVVNTTAVAGLAVSISAAGSSFVGLAGYTLPAPASTPYFVVAYFESLDTCDGLGVAFGHTDGTKFRVLWFDQTNNSWYVALFTNYYTYNSYVSKGNIAFLPNKLWLGMYVDSSGDVTYYTSSDGATFVALTGAISGYLSNLNNVFWGMTCSAAGTPQVTLRCYDVNGGSRQYPPLPPNP
jgi:hypothetical protein